MLHRHAHLLHAIQKFPVFNSGIAVSALGVFLALVPAMPNHGHRHYEWLQVTAMAAYNVATWSAIFTLMALFLRWLLIAGA